MNLKILVLGKNGQLARSLELLSRGNKNEFLFFSSKEIDLLNAASACENLNKLPFDILINAAAYTQVDKAESEKEQSYEINANSVKLIADIVKKKNAKLIHISSDYVYGDSGNNWLIETSPTIPINYYGHTKLESEKFILASGCRHLILRTSWIFSEWGTNFVHTMLRLGKQKDELKVVSDQIGSPTYAVDLAAAILVILERWSNSQQDGIYNIANSGFCNWYEFAKEIFAIAEQMAIPLQIKNVYPIKSVDYPTAAKRQLNSRMNQDKISRTFDLQLPEWKESLNICLKKIIYGET